MKLIIDIDEKDYANIKDCPTDYEYSVALMKIASGTPYEERPQGEWVWVQYDANPNIGNWHCSECHCIPHGKKEYQRTNFCPNCGADMRKGGAE